MKHSFKKGLGAAVTLMIMFGVTSCGTGRNYLIIPHSVSSASAVTVDNLNLSKGDYEVLNSITETASVLCEYKGNQIKISGDSGAFAYIFTLSKFGWVLSNFTGAASLGYFTSDLMNQNTSIPDAEEFARRVAMARIINAAKDYKADGVVEPIVTSRANNVGKNKIEYVSTVSAKLISINTTR
ncbi:MAG: hypothetical protein K2M05_01965 [Paramuribaculum sp.]|nr:hypothetical protein [Paramuribaculum sp.]